MAPIPTSNRDRESDDSHLSLVERRPWMHRLNRRLLLRFRDALPRPPPALPPTYATQSTPCGDTPAQLSATNQSTAPSSAIFSAGRRLCKLFTTPRNLFGLSRKYFAESPPSHDPEEDVSLEDLSDIPEPVLPDDSSPHQFYPYPNISSFMLGDWFWNGSVQKSQADFKDLVDIIGDSNFDPADVQCTNWDSINKQLADDNIGDWVDEDAGWESTPVTISIPFHHRRNIPPSPEDRPRDYTIADFYHRNLVSIIREKLSNPTDAHLFHYEPYELQWQPTDASEPIRVHGELYTSPVFIDAHRELQQSPPEPGCDLPRCVVGLMFWSDATHLTSFGNSKLVPLYLFFGNESKYRRCKPSSHLCEHVAYFQTGGIIFYLNHSVLTLIYL